MLVLTAFSFFKSRLCKILSELCRLKGTFRAPLFEEHAHVAVSLVSSFKATCLATAQPLGCQNCPRSRTSTQAISLCRSQVYGGYTATADRSPKASLDMSAWGWAHGRAMVRKCPGLRGGLPVQLLCISNTKDGREAVSAVSPKIEQMPLCCFH